MGKGNIFFNTVLLAYFGLREEWAATAEQLPRGTEFEESKGSTRLSRKIVRVQVGDKPTAFCGLSPAA